MKDVLKFLSTKQDIIKINMPKGTTVCDLGDSCESLVVLTKGRVKIFSVAEDGRHFTLYQVCPGESCILTASCLFNERVFPAIAVTEEASEGFVISKVLLKEWLKTEPAWQSFIFSLLSQRMGDLIEKVDQLAFNTLETRVIKLLRIHPQAPNISVTHQQLADELASTREVISRLLKKLEDKGLVKLQRGEILLSK